MNPERRRTFAARASLYRENLPLFAREVLGFVPDGWQESVCWDITAHRRVSVKSGQGVGKTCLEAVVALWFLSCFPDARVVATAPTLHQLRDVLWAEIGKWMDKSPLLSHLLVRSKDYVLLRGRGSRSFAVARTASKPENIQGFHADHLLFIVDEASGVAEPVMEAILGTLTGVNNKLLLCGNPTRTSGVFFASHTSDRALYRCHTVNAENCPRADRAHIESLKKKFGADSNVVRVRVYGEFPSQDDDVFIPLPIIERARVAGVPETGSRVAAIACDVARFGGDKTVIGYKIGKHALFHAKRCGQDTMRTADELASLGLSLVERYGGTIPVLIDDGGVGGGVVDRMRQMKRKEPSRYAWMDIIPVPFGRPIRHRHYYDTTTFMMARVKTMLEEENLFLPDDDDLAGQLSGRRYTVTEGGKIKVESKSEMKKRGLPSPDEADCLLLLCLGGARTGGVFEP